MASQERNAEEVSSRAHSIIPKPVRVVPGVGVFRFRPGTVILADDEALPEAQQLAKQLSRSMAFPIKCQAQIAGQAPCVALRLDPDWWAALGEEGYRLKVTPAAVTICAAGKAGLFYGTQTLLQLLPPAVFRKAPAGHHDWAVPSVIIEDRPRFPWRGAMLDVARRFMPVSFVLKFIDLLALHKMNTLHLHLTDDQGWRLEIKKYPRLAAVGGYREETLIGRALHDPVSEQFDPAAQQFDGVAHGGYYTQTEAREIVAYARTRHVTVIPEIEMPGHTRAAIAAYPELGSGDGPVPVGTTWGIYPDILSPSEETITFFQDVLTEVMEVFPSPYIHIGGDEAVKTRWKASTDCQRRMQALGLSAEDEMQSYFVQRMDEFLTAHGRRLVGWDEILDGGLAPGAVVMSWRGDAGGLTAARAGHDVVMAPEEYTYFNHYQSKDWAREPLAFRGYVPLPAVYHFDPVPADLPPECIPHVLGTQGQLWTEYMPGPAQIEYMAYPRLAALAEVAWTSPGNKDFEDFLRRVGGDFRRLDALGVNYRPLTSAER